MFELEPLIRTIGYIGVWIVVFSESGLLVGFFLPGDSFLFTAGVLASQDFLNIWILIPLIFSGAILGDNVGYAFGYRIGPKLFKREDSVFFHKKHLMRAELLYEKYGPKIIVLARFMPVVRTFAPIVAGIGKMKYKTFLIYNLVGGILWGIGMPLFGYFLGSTVPAVDRYIIPIIIGIIFLSILPGVVHVGKAWLRSGS
ncbi:MAG: VTT domain-containing protein [Candidatus Ryanbacteria bacterium]|nr:VTT domain-containing protein [Candidatus Ryanbacteria bacterium]